MSGTATVCPDCGLVFSDGRWQRGLELTGAGHGPCPACRRITDRAPAGYLTLRGPFVTAHRADVLRTARQVAAEALIADPLQRIMAVEAQADAVLITTTEIHLAQALGRALLQAYRGRLHYRYCASDHVLQAYWTA